MTMKEEFAAIDMEYKQLIILFLSVVIIYAAYALAVVFVPISFYQKGVAIFFTAAPAGMLLYHLWMKMRGLEERTRQA